MLKLKHIHLVYGSEKVLHDLSMDVKKGERLVLLGPSGSGKTSILRMIAGFIAPDKGEIRINGTLVAKDHRVIVPPEKRPVGMVFQDLVLWPHLTVKGNIEFGLKASGVPSDQRAERLQWILDMVDLAGYQDKRPTELSGGQQQRVALARALVMQPALLLLDEPLSSLDPQLNQRLRQRLLDLHKKLGFTMVYVTHSMDEARFLADRIVTLRANRDLWKVK